MKDKTERKNHRLRLTGTMLAALVGLLFAGLAAPTHAQICPEEAAKLLASDGAASDNFGRSVSISGDTAIIGADYGSSSGSAYVFTLSGGVWTEQAKLLPADGAEGDLFGRSVSISGDTVVIGALEDDDNGTGSGSAYVFTRSGGVWAQQAELLPADGAAYDRFGYSVSISDDTAVIGANGDDDSGTSSGSAYVFTRSGGVWTQQAKLLPADGAAYDWFGRSASISGDTVVIGANGDDDNGTGSGSAYVFTRSGGVWTQQAKLLPADGAEGDWFGRSVSISGDTAVIGADGDDDNGPYSGSAYVFTRSGGVWTQQAKLLPADGATNDDFGFSVSISGDTAVIGAVYDEDNGPYSGSAYVFTRSGGVWTQQAKLLPADGAANDQFGRSVSISGDTAVIGAVYDDDYGSSSGSAYIFDLGCPPCLADFNGDGLLDFLDVQEFLDTFSAEHPDTDLNNDGAWDFFDVMAYLDAFAAGCP